METKEIVFTLNDILGKITSDIKALILNKHDYQAFILLMIGIELLGNPRVDNAINEKLAESRFKNAVKQFKKPQYRNSLTDLWKLRCSLLHTYRPSPKFVLTSTIVNKAPASLHFSRSNDSKTVLVAEELLADFEDALRRMKNEAKKKPTQFLKLRNEHMTIKKIFIDGLEGSHTPNASGDTTNSVVEKNRKIYEPKKSKEP